MLSQRDIQTNWPKIKSEVLSHWDKLSAADVEKTHGSVNSLNQLVQAKYGKSANFSDEFNKICDQCGTIKQQIDAKIANQRPAASRPATSGSMKANGIQQMGEIIASEKGEIGFHAGEERPKTAPGPQTPAPSEPEVPNAPDEFESPQNPTPNTDVPRMAAGPKEPNLPEKNRTGEDAGSLDSNSKPRVSDQNRGPLSTNSKPMDSQNRTEK